MLPVVLGMVVCIALALLVMGAVAVPARRGGREILTARGEEVVVKVRTSTVAVGQRTSGLVSRAADSAS